MVCATYSASKHITRAYLTDTARDHGSIDVLVNNAAGVGLKDGRVDEISLEDWDAMFASGGPAIHARRGRRLDCEHWVHGVHLG